MRALRRPTDVLPAWVEGLVRRLYPAGVPYSLRVAQQVPTSPIEPMDRLSTGWSLSALQLGQSASPRLPAKPLWWRERSLAADHALKEGTAGSGEVDVPGVAFASILFALRAGAKPASGWKGVEKGLRALQQSDRGTKELRALLAEVLRGESETRPTAWPEQRSDALVRLASVATSTRWEEDLLEEAQLGSRVLASGQRPVVRVLRASLRVVVDACPMDACRAWYGTIWASDSDASTRTSRSLRLRSREALSLGGIAGVLERAARAQALPTPVRHAAAVALSALVVVRETAPARPRPSRRDLPQPALSRRLQPKAVDQRIRSLARRALRGLTDESEARALLRDVLRGYYLDRVGEFVERADKCRTAVTRVEVAEPRRRGRPPSANSLIEFAIACLRRAAKPLTLGELFAEVKAMQLKHQGNTEAWVKSKSLANALRREMKEPEPRVKQGHRNGSVVYSPTRSAKKPVA